MKPRVVIVTQFQPPDPQPGEFSHFQQGYNLEPLKDSPLPGLLFSNPDESLLGIVAGVGAVQTATVITALGLDPRFDLSESLWIISGIAGGDPAMASLGSPVLTDWCVDGDLAWEIDARELPPNWDTGILPLGAKAPYSPPTADDGVFGSRYECSQLPSAILAWARNQLGSVPLAENDEARIEGERYRNCPLAASPPALRVGTTLSAVRFWHGHQMNEWARRWVDLFTQGQSPFITSNMEDSGTLYALRFLAQRGRVDDQRILLIRTLSNFTRPPSGEPSVSTLIAEEGDAHLPGFELALENGYRVARKLITDWLAVDRPPAPIA
ncbi:MAG: purine nucleoside permease [Puniceicoccales bacterium]